MDVHELLQVVAPALGDRSVITDADGSLTAEALDAGAARIGAWLSSTDARQLALVDVNSRTVPLALFGASHAGVPFTPVNYRLADDRLRALLARTAPSVAVLGDGVAERVGDIHGVQMISRQEFLAIADHDAADPAEPGERSSTAVLLFTSGTTGEPKAAILEHDNLTSYVLATVEFASSEDDEATVVSVPPYHIAGVSAILTAMFSGRRIVYLESFEPAAWVSAVIDEKVTHAMVVPTMLGRILDELDRRGVGLPDLRTLSYGGGPMPLAVVERALTMLPHVAFVNAYGLTETASTISILGPDDHRIAFESSDPVVRRRLGSVGRALPSVELTIRDPDGQLVGQNEQGEVWVRGSQVSGHYVGRDDDDNDGWFRTRDAGNFDDDGFLYLHGRLDDVIVRGGENLSPGEIESVMIDHPAVESCAVVGVPDAEWGERVVAAVVTRPAAEVTEDELRDFVRSQLRSTKTPERIQFRDELPMNETGKLLRRVLRDELAVAFAAAPDLN
ncbi:MAG: AMP-dependent synthetase and ligase [Ilumatobacteraceae bacterium]|nr:AMP-dependent synthetase and ligase [Ilumatobacteraceae bacterium]